MYNSWRSSIFLLASLLGCLYTWCNFTSCFKLGKYMMGSTYCYLKATLKVSPIPVLCHTTLNPMSDGSAEVILMVMVMHDLWHGNGNLKRKEIDCAGRPSSILTLSSFLPPLREGSRGGLYLVGRSFFSWCVETIL